MTFTDELGREWEVNLNIASSRPLSSYLKGLDPPVDLFNPAEFYAFLSYPPNAVDALAILCAKQRMERGVSEEQFGEALKGSSAFNARHVLNEEYLSFYPDPEMVEILKRTQTQLEESSKREERLISKFLGQVAENYSERVTELEKTMFSTTSQSGQLKDGSEQDIKS